MTPRKLKPMLIGSLLLLCFGNLRAQELKLDLHLRESFFGSDLKPGDKSSSEIRYDPLHWKDATHAAVEFQVWWTKGAAKIETGADRTSVQSLGVFPNHTEPQADGWNFWRQKHGYALLPDKGYAWSALDDSGVAMDPAVGKYYDAYLKNIWSYWLLETLPSKLNESAASQNEIDSDDRGKWIKKQISLSLSDSGIVRPTPLLFKIHLWSMPVQVFFTVTTSTLASPTKELVLQKGFQWKFDMHEWRRLHGYEKNLWGGYDWNTHFPNSSSLDKEEGRKLDYLLEKSVSYWVEVAVNDILANMNEQLTRSKQSTK